MISKNAAGLVLLALSVLGINVTEADMMQVISALGTLVSFVLMIVNQWNRPDVKGFFFKK